MVIVTKHYFCLNKISLTNFRTVTNRSKFNTDEYTTEYRCTSEDNGFHIICKDVL